MNKLYILVLFLCAICIAACQREAFPDDCHETAVRFSSILPDNLTRVGITQSGTRFTMEWNANDQIGIYARGAVSGNNCPYRSVPEEGNAAACSFLPAENGRYYPFTPGSVTYYAYLPFSVEAGEDGPESVHVSIPEKQLQSQAGNASHLASSFFMKAVPVTAEDGESVSLSFRGVFSIVEIRLKTAAGEVQASGIRLESESGPLSFDGIEDLTSAVAKTTVEDGRLRVELALSKPVSVKTAIQKFYMTVAPGCHPVGTLKLFVVSTEGKEHSYNLPAVTFEPGRNYMQTVVIDPLNF